MQRKSSLNSLSKCTIKSISLEDCSIGSALLIKLGVGSCASLQKLSLVRCSVNQASISDLLSTITSHHFEHLELVSCNDRYDHSANPVALRLNDSAGWSTFEFTSFQSTSWISSSCLSRCSAWRSWRNCIWQNANWKTWLCTYSTHWLLQHSIPSFQFESAQFGPQWNPKRIYQRNLQAFQNTSKMQSLDLSGNFNLVTTRFSSRTYQTHDNASSSDGWRNVSWMLLKAAKLSSIHW